MGRAKSRKALSIFFLSLTILKSPPAVARSSFLPSRRSTGTSTTTLRPCLDHSLSTPSIRPLGNSVSRGMSGSSLDAEQPEQLPPHLLSLREHLGRQQSGEEDGGKKNKVRLILASQSPRRREILTMMGLGERFDAIPSPLDEEGLQIQLLQREREVDPKNYTRHLAEEKAKALADDMLRGDGGSISSSSASSSRSQQPTLVLGSDTIVELDGQILEKPKNEADAKRMLSKLSGREHAVHTGVAIVRILPAGCSTSTAAVAAASSSSEVVSSFTDTARVRFAALAEDDIDAYVQTGEPSDKAGSYGIQGIGGQFVSEIRGDFFTVMGLPMHRVSKELAKAVQDVLAAEFA